MTKFELWFDNQLIVGAKPLIAEWNRQRYEVVVNVSGQFQPEIANSLLYDYHWFALSEQKRDMGLNSIFMALVILWQAEMDNLCVYLHCHSGSNRSWTVAAAYYYLRSGRHLDRPTRSGGYINKLAANCHRGYLPPQAEMESWLRYVGKEIKDGLRPESLTMSKIETIKN